MPPHDMPSTDPVEDTSANLRPKGTCRSGDHREAYVEEVFNIEGRHYQVEDVPHMVCARFGEQS